MSKYQAVSKYVDIQIEKYEEKKNWLAFTWPSGDSDADDTVVEQQQPSALCSRHLHNNTKRKKISLKTQSVNVNIFHL